MIDIAWIIWAWIGVGLISCAGMTISDWWEGRPVTVNIVVVTLLCSMLGPVMLIFFIGFVAFPLLSDFTRWAAERGDHILIKGRGR